MGKSRVLNTTYNFISNIGGLLITIVMQFAVRTVFIKTLGSSYLGIDGLFSNILTMLSLADLGVGSAMLFKLYEPISKKDEHRITILIKFYKKIYTFIGIVVAVIGLCLIPFLPVLINDYNSLSALGINAILIYLLYLMQSVSSYLFFVYKTSIIKADQKEYLLNIISYVFTLMSGIIQIISLIFFKSFELYVLILISTTILQNLAGAILASKLYPYINNKTKDRVDKKEVKELFKDCRAIILYRINDVVLKATDNLVISASLGLAAVGIYSNYYILYRTINQIFNKIFESVVHSLGNLHTEKNYNHEYVVFKTTNFIAIILGATAGIGVFCVSNELIFLWIGKKWILAQPFSLLMGFEAYTLASRLYLSRWRTAMGLFQQAKYRPVFAMIINLIVSIILVKYLGICGVLIGTIIADWTTIIWYEPLIIHKHGLKNKFSLKLYYLKNFSYLLVLIFAAFINYEICKNLFLGLGWLSFAIHTLICGMLTPLIFLFIYRKTDEGKYFIGILKKQFKRKKLRRA